MNRPSAVTLGLTREDARPSIVTDHEYKSCGLATSVPGTRL